MNKAILVFLFASSLAAQVQIGKNVQIGAAGTTGGSTVGTAGQLQMTDGSGGHAASSVTDDGTNVTSTKPLVVNASGNGIKSTEGTAPSGVSSSDLLYPDSTAHRWKMNNNNGGATAVVGYADWGGTPATTASTNVVGAGDSRMAGSTVPAGQDYLTYLAAQPQFSGRANFFNAGFGGDTCSAMTGRYAGSVQPHKPSGAITTSYLLIEEGINDILTGVSIGTLETCYSAYLATAVADGFTPVLNTVYFTQAATDAQDLIRLQFNDYLRQLGYLVIDVDYLFPSTDTFSNPYWVDQTHLNGPGNLLWAKETNYLWGLGKSGTTFTPLGSSEHDIYTPLSGQNRYTGALIAGISPNASIPAGYLMSNVTSTEGAVLLGADRNCYVYRAGGTLSIPSNCGPLTISNSMTATSYKSTPGTFSALPTCNSGAEGTTSAVTDSSTATWGATVTGGSTNHILAYCNGTNWTVAAK